MTVIYTAFHPHPMFFVSCYLPGELRKLKLLEKPSTQSSTRSSQPKQRN